MVRNNNKRRTSKATYLKIRKNLLYDTSTGFTENLNPEDYFNPLYVQYIKEFIMNAVFINVA